MTLPDLMIVLLLAGFTFSGFFRGFTWELITAAGLAAGFGLVYLFHEDLLRFVAMLAPPGWQRPWLGALVFVLCFLAVYFGFATLGRKLHEGIEKTPFKWPDRALGLAAGLLKGVVFVGLLVIAVEWLGTGSSIRSFMAQSQLVRWGKRVVHEFLNRETEEQKQWV